jgi:hypothetical protein
VQATITSHGWHVVFFGLHWKLHMMTCWGNSSLKPGIGALHAHWTCQAPTTSRRPRSSGNVQPIMSNNALEIFENGSLSDDPSWWNALGRHTGNGKLEQVSTVRKEQDRTIVQSNCTVNAFCLCSSDFQSERVVLKQVNLLRNRCVLNVFSFSNALRKFREGLYLTERQACFSSADIFFSPYTHHMV